MQNAITIVALQLNATMGALTANAENIRTQAWLAYEQHQADLIITPELALTGYPAEDLLLRQDFMAAVAETLTTLCLALPPTDIILGVPLINAEDKTIRNTLVYVRDHKIYAHYDKQILPNDGVFDDKRYFVCGIFQFTSQRSEKDFMV